MIEKGTRELHTAPDPLSTVPCPLRSREHIAMGRCVEYQRDNGCHCEHALVALRRTQKHLRSPTGLLTAYDTTARADAIDGVHALIERAEAMEKARPARVPTPATPRPTLAQTYREAQRTEVAEAVLATRATRQTPAKENIVARYEMGPCKHQGCTEQVATTRSKTGLCNKHRQVVYRAPAPAKAPPAPVKALPARKPAPASTRSAPPADIISLLEHQLGHHEEQAEKCRRALAALR